MVGVISEAYKILLEKAYPLIMESDYHVRKVTEEQFKNLFLEYYRKSRNQRESLKNAISECICTVYGDSEEHSQTVALRIMSEIGFVSHKDEIDRKYLGFFKRLNETKGKPKKRIYGLLIELCFSFLSIFMINAIIRPSFVIIIITLVFAAIVIPVSLIFSDYDTWKAMIKSKLKSLGLTLLLAFGIKVIAHLLFNIK